MKRGAKRPAWVVGLVVVAAVAYQLFVAPPERAAPVVVGPGLGVAAREGEAVADDGGIGGLFAARTSDAWVEAGGVVRKVLKDDDDAAGGLHQRWIVELAGGHEVLIAHNHGAAGRVPVKEGEAIRFRGEYEWTEKGGTVHFTHAPEKKRREPGGWVEHGGRRYE